MRVLFLPEVRDYFRELAQTLYDRGYFGFEESAVRYAEELFNDIAGTLPTRTRKHAPVYFDRYGRGMFYSVFKKSNRTQWYVFFSLYADGGEVTHLVRYMSNNHMISSS